MSLRSIVDANGVAWELWEVQPSLVEKRDADNGVPATGERRHTRSVRMRVSPAMRDGWLAIRSATERRRIAPIPPGWETMPEEALRELIARSEAAGARRRLAE